MAQKRPGVTTQALLVRPYHSVQHNCKKHPARHPGGQETTGPPEKKLGRQHTRMNTSRPTDPATHSRGQTTLARTLCERHPYDRPYQGIIER